MARKVWITVFVGVLAIGGGRTIGAGGGSVEPRRGFRCSEATLRGTYGIQMQGTRPVPPPLGGGFETVIGVVIRTYDGVGNFTQVDNVKGSVTGIVPDRPGFGTYQVSADCMAATQFEPGPGISIEERLVIVDDGDEVRSIVTSPLAVMMSTVQKRIKTR